MRQDAVEKAHTQEGYAPFQYSVGKLSNTVGAQVQLATHSFHRISLQCRGLSHSECLSFE